MNTTEKHVSTANAFDEAASLMRQQRSHREGIRPNQRGNKIRLAEALAKTSRGMRSV